jgi:hypothetical protein
MPIKLFQAGGELHMMRLDLNNQNEPIENWQEEQTTEGAAGHERSIPAAPINNAEVEKRFAVEAGKTTK